VTQSVETVLTKLRVPCWNRKFTRRPHAWVSHTISVNVCGVPLSVFVYAQWAETSMLIREKRDGDTRISTWVWGWSLFTYCNIKRPWHCSIP